MRPINSARCLPADLEHAVLVGRVWQDNIGPTIVAVRGDAVVDISAHAPTMADLVDRDDALDLAANAPGDTVAELDALFSASLARRATPPVLLAPCDVQAIKACGVTFATSLLERVVEEYAGGDPERADAIRQQLDDLIGADLSQIRPGSSDARELEKALKARGAWSQYLEVGIGKDAEVFSKTQPMAAVGFGASVGLHPDSAWNNPEPEIVLAVDSRGRPRGATLGNDVNLRDFEGRSALLLSKAKDNNGSTAIGPFLRLFDHNFGLDDIRRAEVGLTIEGVDDDFDLHATSDMRKISRDPLDLVAQTVGPHHQYPDGFMLFLGTMFSPTDDRDRPGAGFTHHVGDRVAVETPALGALVNAVHRSDAIPPWRYATRALFTDLARRGLIDTTSTAHPTLKESS